MSKRKLVFSQLKVTVIGARKKIDKKKMNK